MKNIKELVSKIFMTAYTNQKKERGYWIEIYVPQTNKRIKARERIVIGRESTGSEVIIIADNKIYQTGIYERRVSRYDLSIGKEGSLNVCVSMGSQGDRTYFIRVPETATNPVEITFLNSITQFKPGNYMLIKNKDTEEPIGLKTRIGKFEAKLYLY